ncbi:unnamed protein product [Symbiodinium sp. CCMP2456]|nr:unnamed protein product [Symbiodinium sp. CCMP2456]
MAMFTEFMRITATRRSPNGYIEGYPIARFVVLGYTAADSAEVQRQLEEYTVKYQVDFRTLELINVELVMGNFVYRIVFLHLEMLLNSFKETRADLKGEIHADLKRVFTKRMVSEYREMLLNSFKETRADLKGEIHAGLKGVLTNQMVSEYLEMLRNSFEEIQVTGGVTDDAQSLPEITSGPMPNDAAQWQQSESADTKAVGAMDTPSQWLGGSGNADTMAFLAGGMAQLQAVILKQMKDKDKDGSQPRGVGVGKVGLMVKLALHESARQEMVQRRSTGSVTALVFRLLTIYQPGGQQEKMTIAAPGAGPRCPARRESPEIMAPLVAEITKTVLEKEAEANFRTSSERSHLMVDTKPSYAGETGEASRYYIDNYCACSFTAITPVPFPSLMGWFGKKLVGAWLAAEKSLREGLPEQEAALDLRPFIFYVHNSTAEASRSSTAAGMGQADLKEVLADNGKMLKTMTATSLKAIKVKEDTTETEGDMMMKRVFDEAKKEEEETGLWTVERVIQRDQRARQSSSGTILVQEEKATVQLIVKTVHVKIRNHCPEVAAADALNLIRELEVAQETREWTELLKEFSTTGSRPTLLKTSLTSPITKGLPSDVQSLLLEGFDPRGGERYLTALPLSRRKRRSLMCCRNWVVNWFFGPIPMSGKVVLDILTSQSPSIGTCTGKEEYQLLPWAAADGRISDVISSPPHSSWPTSMTPARGPEAYPARTSHRFYGIKDLTAAQRQRVDNETALVAKQMLVWLMAQMCGKRALGFLMESTAGCERLREGEPTGPTAWDTELWKSFWSVSGIREVPFYMGAFDHKAKRPTTLATTYPSLNQIDKNYDFGDRCVPPSLLSRADMRKWSKSFKAMVAEAIQNHHTGRW